MFRTTSIALALLLLSGCANQSFNMSGTATNNATQDKSQHFFVNGIGQKKAVNAAEVCGGADKVASVEVQQTFVNGFFSVITMGIYTPRSARVYCTG